MGLALPPALNAGRAPRPSRGSLGAQPQGLRAVTFQVAPSWLTLPSRRRGVNVLRKFGHRRVASPGVLAQVRAQRADVERQPDGVLQAVAADLHVMPGDGDVREPGPGQDAPDPARDPRSRTAPARPAPAWRAAAGRRRPRRSRASSRGFPPPAASRRTPAGRRPSARRGYCRTQRRDRRRTSPRTAKTPPSKPPASNGKVWASPSSNRTCGASPARDRARASIGRRCRRPSTWPPAPTRAPSARLVWPVPQPISRMRSPGRGARAATTASPSGSSCGGRGRPATRPRPCPRRRSSRPAGRRSARRSCARPWPRGAGKARAQFDEAEARSSSNCPTKQTPRASFRFHRNG